MTKKKKCKPFRITVDTPAMMPKNPMAYYETMRRELFAIHKSSGEAIKAFEIGDTDSLQICIQLLVEAVTAFGAASQAFSNLSSP